MLSFAPTSPRQHAIGLAILRVITGVIFVAHGSQKLFVYGLDGVTAGFGQMGIPLAGVVAPLVALLEFAGGLALIAGLYTRVLALAFAGDMAGAVIFAHLPNGFFAPRGIEFTLLLLAVGLAFAFVGAGAASVDARLAARRTRREPGTPPVRRAA